MAGVDVGTGGNKRALNREINMIPFIDFLLVTVAFLLITAVWQTHSRMEVDARQPGATTGPVDPGQLTKDLHVFAGETDFTLTWKQGSTVISETRIARPEARPGEAPQYQDRCVLHTDNELPFREVVAVMDAIYEAKRDSRQDNGQLKKVPAFVMAFASQ
ncbi:MAG: biopolymer transporter ExbD [Deltaproteobacteria bacterium]|nr:biopolymer transporter ExbD [Deltaproteobacteria bacterium]